MALSQLQRSIVCALLGSRDARIVRHSQFTPMAQTKAGKSEVLIPGKPPWPIPGHVTSKLIRNGWLGTDTATSRYTTLQLTDEGRRVATAATNPDRRRRST